jgi:tRNA dimethylallyltransferase
MTNIVIKSTAGLKQLISRHLRQAVQQKKIPLLVVMGPTASGKTALGIALARALDGEIISADSRQIYRRMSVGTAAPTAAEKQLAKHHLVEFINPDQPFNLSLYQQKATRLIKMIFHRGHLPVLVGGTGLYVSAITENYQLPESVPDLSLRNRLEKLAARKGKLAVHDLLQQLNPQAAAKIHPNNLRYVIRAVEIAAQSGEKLADPSKNPTGSEFYPLFITVDWPRDQLYSRIEQRIDQQMQQGLLRETKALLRKYDFSLPSVSSLGYREIGTYLQGLSSLEEALCLFKKNTRNFAKRQLTWFRKFPQVYSVPGDSLKTVCKALMKPKLPL